MGIYKRKQELDQESDQEKKKETRELDRESDHEKKTFFFSSSLISVI